MEGLVKGKGTYLSLPSSRLLLSNLTWPIADAFHNVKLKECH